MAEPVFTQGKKLSFVCKSAVYRMSEQCETKCMAKRLQLKLKVLRSSYLSLV